MADAHCNGIVDWPLIYTRDKEFAGSTPASSTNYEQCGPKQSIN